MLYFVQFCEIYALTSSDRLYTGKNLNTLDENVQETLGSEGEG